MTTPLHDAVVAYLDFLKKSVNVGPLTKNPSKEAALLRRLQELTAAPPQRKNGDPCSSCHQPYSDGDTCPAGRGGCPMGGDF